MLYVRFYADKYATGRGFIANYSQAEAQIINGMGWDRNLAKGMLELNCACPEKLIRKKTHTQ